MITKIEAYNPKDLSYEFLIISSSLIDSEPIQIRNIDGLGPVKASINTAPFGAIDGEAYRGSSMGKRNIVISFGLNPNWSDETVGSLRQSLYDFFMPKMSTRLRLYSDELPTCDISGYVESCEPNIFSKDPDVQVSIICPDPDFVDIELSTAEGIIGTPEEAVATEIEYIGTRPTGVKLTLSSTEDNLEYVGYIDINNAVPGLTQTFSLTEVSIGASPFFIII